MLKILQAEMQLQEQQVISNSQSSNSQLTELQKQVGRHLARHLANIASYLVTTDGSVKASCVTTLYRTLKLTGVVT